MNKKPRWYISSLRRFLFAHGYVLVPRSEIDALQAIADADYKAMRRHESDTLERGYFNGLADMASKTAAKLRRFYPY